MLFEFCGLRAPHLEYEKLSISVTESLSYGPLAWRLASSKDAPMIDVINQLRLLVAEDFHSMERETSPLTEISVSNLEGYGPFYSIPANSFSWFK